MIIMTDGKSKQLVRIKDWEDITERQGFKAPLDIKKGDEALEAVIGQYEFDYEVACGIASCRTGHKRGYLTVTKSGIETNIGNKCGKDIFGISFDELKGVFRREVNAQAYRENILTAQNQADYNLQKIKDIRTDKEGAIGSYALMREIHKSQGWSPQMVSKLKLRAKRGENLIQVERVATEAEREALNLVDDDKDEYIKDTLGIISGISAFLSYKEIKTILDQLTDRAKQLKSLQVDLLNHSELKKWSRWCGSIDKSFVELQELDTDCKRFLTEPNLKLIKQFSDYL